jgi:hypothetical protein
MLAGVELPSGEWRSFTGKRLEDVVSQLRGDPGTELTVVAMRPDPNTGKLREYRSVVSREQLIFTNKSG